MKSVLQTKKECFLCRELFGIEGTINLEEHHIFSGTSNRKQSERLGLKVWLCYEHHRGTAHGVHFNAENAQTLHEYAQRYFEANLGSRRDFISVFGHNYL